MLRKDWISRIFGQFYAPVSERKATLRKLWSFMSKLRKSRQNTKLSWKIETVSNNNITRVLVKNLDQLNTYERKWCPVAEVLYNVEWIMPK